MNKKNWLALIILCLFAQCLFAVDYVAVPDLYNLTQDDAEAAIIDAGLTIGDINFQHNDTVLEGYVFEQDPGAFYLDPNMIELPVQVPLATSVDFSISLGPWPYHVPDLSGLNLPEAETAILDAGLIVGNVSYQRHKDIPEDLIISQLPSPGTGMESIEDPNAFVKLVVSLGPWPYYAPDLYGLTLSEAETAIIDAGLQVGDISYGWDPNMPIDFIFNQYPAPGVGLKDGIDPNTGMAAVPSISFVISLGEFDLLQGSGTENDPYLIQNLDDFDILANPNSSSALWGDGVYTQLDCDLDLSGRKYYDAVIANNMEFSGIFDGCSFSISNLVIDSNRDYIGLFGTISSVGCIKNLYCADFVIDGYDYCGTVCGINYGVLNKCSVSGDINGDSSLGGLCGTNYGEINCSAANCSVHCGYSDSYVGGLCGYNRGVITNSSAFGSVSGGANSACIGGLCGYNDYGDIVNCYAVGDISGGDKLGGLCGRNYYGEIVNCYAVGDVSGEDYIGGLCGYNYYGTISKCYSIGFVSGDQYTCGFCGFQTGNQAKISKCFWDIETSGTSIGNSYSVSSVSDVLGKTTEEMQDINTFLSAGWDFIDESHNGSDDIWMMADYPNFSSDYSTYWGVIPDLNNLTQNDAIWDIFDAGLLVGFIYYSDEYPVDPDHVISQYPAPGLPGSRVDLLVSLGYFPIMPDIIGLSEADARAAIESTFLNIGEIKYQFNDSVPYGCVISQNPEPLNKVPGDTPIDFIVSLGSPLTVPDLAGMTQAEAEAAVLNAGLPIGQISYRYNNYNGVPKDYIISQSITPGEIVHLETSINIVVSLGLYVPLEGSGTENDPYLIYNLDDFDKFTDPNSDLLGAPSDSPDYLAEGVHTRLMADLDFSSKPAYSNSIVFGDVNLIPPGNSEPNSSDSLSYHFDGNFDGNGHTISNVTINSYHHYIGLFGGLSQNATVSNLGCVNFNISGTMYCGILAGSSNGTISNCYSTGSVSGENYLGGLCGQNSFGDITNCYAAGSVKGYYRIGGFCGTSSGDIINCYYYLFAGPNSGNGVPLDDHQLQNQSSFIGFDFTGDDSDGTDDIWSITPGYMPRLSWQDSPGFEPLYLLNTISTTLNGTGYSDDPFIINNLDDMFEFRNNDALRIGCFSLQNNIDFTVIL